MSISIEDFSKIYDKVNIIDIRSSELYLDGHIPNSINIDPNALINSPQEYLDIYKRYYIYCEFGNGSLSVCKYLNKLGYEVVNLIGGFNSWLKWNIK